MKLNLPKEPAFFERYGTFQGFGYGCMLVFWSGAWLEYVLFTPEKGPKKEVISRELLDKYKKEMFGTPVEAE